MIPLYDKNPTARPAIVTVLLIGAIAAVSFFVLPRGGADQLRFNYAKAAVPCELVRGRPLTIDEIDHGLGGHDRFCNSGR